MPYKCLSCAREIDDEDIDRRVRCPYCGYRIVAKKRAEGHPVHVDAV